MLQLFIVVCYIQMSGGNIPKKVDWSKLKSFCWVSKDKNGYALELICMMLCVQWGSQGGCVCFVVTVALTESERAGGRCHSAASALIIKICCTMVGLVRQSFNFGSNQWAYREQLILYFVFNAKIIIKKKDLNRFVLSLTWMLHHNAFNFLLSQKVRQIL